MSGKEIDRVRARGAVTVIKQQPVMVLFAVWLALGLLAPTRGDLSRTPGGC
jgi:hypothetical protein